MDNSSVKTLLYRQNSAIVKKEKPEGGFLYETICYVCIALAIAIKTMEAMQPQVR